MAERDSTPQRIALLIDADNAPASKIEPILDELSKHGVINVRRAYGNWKKAELKAWEACLHEYAIRPMQQFDYSKGKNASDMALVVDAMELLYTDQPQAFGLVSSDADFTPLVMHLKSKGAVVYGFGQSKTPEPFQRACSTFLLLENLGSVSLQAGGAALEPAEGGATAECASAAQTDNAVAPPERVPTGLLRQDTRLVNLLRGAVDALADEEGWAALGAVGKHINNQASFDARNYGYAKLSGLFEATELFEVQRRPDVYVRDLRVAKARGKAKTKTTSPPAAAHG